MHRVTVAIDRAMVDTNLCHESYRVLWESAGERVSASIRQVRTLIQRVRTQAAREPVRITSLSSTTGTNAVQRRQQVKSRETS